MKHQSWDKALYPILSAKLHNPSPVIVVPIVAGIGNALLAVPMLRQLKRRIPDSRIVILARIDSMAEVFRRLREVDEVFVTGTGFAGILRMIRASRQRRADLYLVPFPSNRWQYSLLALTSGAGRKVLHGYPVGYWRALHFIGERIPAQRGLHDVEQNLALLRAIGIEPDPPQPPTFELDEQDRAAAAGMLADAGIDGQTRPIVIHAGSAKTVLAQAKRWPASAYAELIAALAQEFGDPIALVEGPDELGVADEILGQLRDPVRPVVLQLNGPLGHAGAVLERARLYVGSDSGLAHLAAAVGTPPVTIFAAADPMRVCPFGFRHLVVQAPTPCAPCFAYPWQTPYPKVLCTAPLCVEKVTVPMVLAAVHRALHAEHEPAPAPIENRA